MNKRPLVVISIIILILPLINGCEGKRSNENSQVVEVSPAVESKTETTVSKLNNPAIFYGGSFGEFFQQLYKQGHFSEMIKYTSNESVKHHGTESLMQAYKKMEFGFKLKLKSLTNNENGVITLNYSSLQFATNKVLRMNVKVENDTVKFIAGSDLSNMFVVE